MHEDKRLDNQVLSRSFSIGAGETKTVLDFHRDDRWRFTVTEKDVTTALLIKITTGYPNTSEVIEFNCGPGGAVEYAGCNSASIEIRANAQTNIDVTVGPFYDNQFVLERDGGRQTIGSGAWTPLGPNATGSTPPFMNFLAIGTDRAIDVRTVNMGGAVVFQALAVPSDSLLLQQFKISNNDLVEVRGTIAANQPCRAVWYNRR